MSYRCVTILLENRQKWRVYECGDARLSQWNKVVVFRVVRCPVFTQHVELNKLSAFEHPVERCRAVLSLVESNLKLVNAAQCFLCFAVNHVWLNKVECICTATLTLLSPRTRSAQHIQKLPWVIRIISLQPAVSSIISLCCCSILYCFYAESTLLFYHVVFFALVSLSMISLT